MTFSVKVDGGTGAGSKRPLMPANTIPWPCSCPELDRQGGERRETKLNPGYLVRCIDCGTQRP